jgi:predicted metal-dependent phosphoesterase TrpH
MNGTIDLHCHSTASDGTLTPAEVVARAHAQGVEILALTDHDTVAGLAEARVAAQRHGIRLIPALELSATEQGRGVHVVGLGVDPAAPQLTALIARLDRMREERAVEIGARLGRAGVAGAYEGARSFAAGALPTRTHFARFLVQQGLAKDVGDVFKRYLAQGKTGYVPSVWPALAEVVAVIRASGGIAVLAHPHAYGWTGAWTRRILEAFVAAGGRGIEVVCGNSNRDNIATAAGHARRFDLLASVGSDFHEPGNAWTELGRVQPLPADLRPVWDVVG